MKGLLTIAFSLILLHSFSQRRPVDFSEIDRRVESIKFSSPPLLAKQLVAFCNTDQEKVRAIFKWITNNIEYRTKQVFNKKGIPIAEENDDNSPLKSLDERVAEMVLIKGSAVCDGYARLFKTLCTYAGIQSEIITGYGRVNKYPRRFGNNHTWNAVMIDSSWQLLDFTWASGFISWTGNNFVRSFDESYFLASPEKFILEHYPDNIAWSLMEQPPLLVEFRSSPFKQKTFGKYKIASYKPLSGIIEVNQGDSVQLELEAMNIETDRSIGADPFLDIQSFNTNSSAVLSPSLVQRNKIIYNYYANSPLVQWLYVQYNNDVIMRYRLIVKNSNAPKEIAVR